MGRVGVFHQDSLLVERTADPSATLGVCDFIGFFGFLMYLSAFVFSIGFYMKPIKSQTARDDQREGQVLPCASVADGENSRSLHLRFAPVGMTIHVCVGMRDRRKSSPKQSQTLPYEQSIHDCKFSARVARKVKVRWSSHISTKNAARYGAPLISFTFRPGETCCALFTLPRAVSGRDDRGNRRSASIRIYSGTENHPFATQAHDPPVGMTIIFGTEDNV